MIILLLFERNFTPRNLESKEKAEIRERVFVAELELVESVIDGDNGYLIESLRNTPNIGN